MNGFQWIIFLIILINLAFNSDQCDQYNSIIENCSCQRGFGGEVEFHCPSFDNYAFNIKMRNEFIEVQCNNTSDWSTVRFVDWSDFSLNSIFARKFQKKVRISWCPLPQNYTLAEISQHLGIHYLEELNFQSHRDLSNALTRRHFENLSDLLKLTLSNNGLRSFRKEILQNLPNLVWLDLRDNEIETLPQDVFEYNQNLSLLELGRNRLDRIDPGTFRTLSNLTFLNLWRNQLTELHSGAFDGLVSLVSLDLNTNALTDLHPNIFNDLVNLEVLYLYGNNFTTLPSDLLRGKTKLKTVHLYDNRNNLTLPNAFFSNLVSLESLKLKGNKLISLPENLFWGTRSLKNLHIERNSLVTLPQDVFQDAVNLAVLDLSFNDLQSLPDHLFRNCRKLVFLDLSKNGLTAISEFLFYGLASLQVLNMEQNNLKVIHGLGLTYLTKLKIARFDNNNLTLKPYIYGYQDEYGTISPFHQCKELENLSLAHNNISEMFSDWIVSSPMLRELDLQYNNFSYISIEDLQFISNDNIRVNLSYNNISRIILIDAENIAIEQNKPRNAIVDVNNNPIICDCYLYSFLRYLEGRMHPYVQNYVQIMPGDLKCNGPKWLKNRNIADLKSTNLKCLLDESLHKMACLEECDCWLRPEDKAFLVDCSNRNLTLSNRVYLTNLIPNLQPYRIELNFTGNSLTQIPNIDARNVVSLLLSHNNISEIPMETLPITLEELELDNNNITSISTDMVEFMKNSSLMKLTLHNNPWQCNCNTRDFLTFIQAKSVAIPELLEVKCDGMSMSISKMTASDLCPKETTMIVGISMAIAVMGLIVGTAAALYYRYQQEIKIWLYARQWCLWFVTEDELDKDKMYDAFISYSHKDEEFVINELVSKLESGPRPFKLCIHIRNWQAGEWIPTQIARSVQDSKRTIVVLSPNFLKSVWGRMEFRAAHSQALSEGRTRVILIIYGEIGLTEDLDPELRTYIGMNTYVKWGDPWFWDKLRYAMPHPVELTKGLIRRKVLEKHQPCMKVCGEKNGLVSSTLPMSTLPSTDSLKATILV